MQALYAAVSIALLFATGAATDTADVFVASDNTNRPGWSEVSVPKTATALALSPDGLELAYSQPSAGKAGFSEIVRSAWPGHAGGDRVGHTVTLAGEVRDLLFLDSRELIGLQYRPAKKRIGETFLFRISVGSTKAERVMRVPPSSSDLDRWPGGDAILLACRNEIRTLFPPDYRSGPLFSVPGYNLAVSSLGSSSFVLVGQSEALLLIDLSAPSGRESMPVLLTRDVPAPVDALADYPSGKEVLVRLNDDRLFRASFDPAGFLAVGQARYIAGLAKASSGPRLPFAVTRSASTSSDAETPPSEPPPPPPQVAPKPAPTIRETVPAVAEVAAPVPSGTEHIGETSAPPAPEAEQMPAPPVTEPQAEPPPKEVVGKEPAPTQPPVATRPVRGPDAADGRAPDTPTPQLRGRIIGDTGLVREVVLLGPNNILREAARIAPDEQGRWRVNGLEPGRYRILVDGGGDRVLVAEPRFVVVDLGAEPLEAPQINVLRSF